MKIIHLSPKDAEIFVEAITSLDEASDALKKAVADSKAAIASGELTIHD